MDIVLGRFREADVDELVAADHEPEIRRRFGTPAGFTPSRVHSMAVLARWDEARRAKMGVVFAIREASSGILLGGCELQSRPGRVANLSYWTYQKFRNRGVASRAIPVAMSVAFDLLVAEAIEALVAKDNPASLLVARRSGFIDVGVRDKQHLLVAKKPLQRSSVRRWPAI